MGKGNSLEKNFAQAAEKAGYKVKQAGAIRVDKAVEDRNGHPAKVVTQPDFYVTNPDTKKSVYVEIGNGKKHDNGHKAAQMRVVEKAGVENYVQLTGHQVEQLKETKSVKELKRLLVKMLYSMLIF